MLNVQSISLDTEFTLQINNVFPVLSGALEQEVEHLWHAAQQQHGKALFNGSILSASTVSHNKIHGYISEYRHLIAQRAKPALFKQLQVRPVAVSGLLECPEGVVLGRRANSMTQDAGLWELVPSGGIDTSKMKEAGQPPSTVPFLPQILTELQQEIGIHARSVSRVKPFCLVDDTDSHVVDIGIIIESPLSYDEILTAHRNTATKEYDELKLVPRSEINQFIQDEAMQLVGVSAALIRHFCRLSLMAAI